MPVNLVYVAHGERMTDVSPEDRRLYSSVDTGFIGQNVYLFCASEGLATVFRAAIDYAKLTLLMRLPEQLRDLRADSGLSSRLSAISGEDQNIPTWHWH